MNGKTFGEKSTYVTYVWSIAMLKFAKKICINIELRAHSDVYIVHRIIFVRWKENWLNRSVQLFNTIQRPFNYAMNKKTLVAKKKDAKILKREREIEKEKNR